MAAAENQNAGAKTFTTVVSVLMAVLIFYGLLTLLGVVR